MQVKCKFCGEKGDNKDLNQMIRLNEFKPKTCIGWYHITCYPQFLEERKRIDAGNTLRDQLNEVICQIYDVPSVPSFLWMVFDAWSKGNAGVYRGKETKKPKYAIGYDVIAEAYKMSEKDIQWARKNKGFSSTEGEMGYGYKIMCGKINDAYKKLKHQAQAQIVQTQMMEMEMSVHKKETEPTTKQTYRRKKDKGDISDFLD